MKAHELKRQIFDLVGEYYNEVHKTESKFKKGDRISYAGRCFNEREMINLVDASLDFWLTAGVKCNEFEEKFAAYLGVKKCFLVNSGSSANLLAFMSLTSPLLGDRAIKRGDEIITIAASFPTTIAPIIQYGAVPVFVDIAIPTYNIDVELLADALSSKTKAIMIAHTLGNPFDLKAVKSFCEEKGLWLIEDNCDALGSTYEIDGKEYFTGSIGDIGTSSFYPPHHITMGEGGAVYTSNPLLAKIMLSMRDWGRDCVCESGQDNLCNKRFSKQYGLLPNGYDHKYVYSHFGYNLKATEMQAAIGLEQLKKLDYFVEVRRRNFMYIYNKLSKFSNYLVLPEATMHANPSWFGFLLSTKPGVNRDNLVRCLEDKNIQTRMLFASNIILHPCFDHIRDDELSYKVIGTLSNTNNVINNSFWIGVSPLITFEKIDYIVEIIRDYFKTL